MIIYERWYVFGFTVTVKYKWSSWDITFGIVQQPGLCELEIAYRNIENAAFFI